MGTPTARLPVIDVGPLVDRASPLDDRLAVGREIARACRDSGFFYATGHGVDPHLEHRLEGLARAFFARDLDEKLAIRMARGGRSWRGYFPVGRELTSGVPDGKEGLYFGQELPADDPRIRRGLPLHGPNLFPAEPPGLRAVVLAYIAALTRLGHALMSGIALGLGLEESYFAERYTADPLILFRIFNYPAAPSGDAAAWGVGEHTDYGFLGIVRQDETGGLEVRSGNRWLEASPVEGSFVCNVGDMLERVSRGHLRSTPHRVRPPSRRDRLSLAFFFDPSFNATVAPIEGLGPVSNDTAERWDGRSVHELSGTYGEYLMSKVSKVFPYLYEEVT